MKKITPELVVWLFSATWGLLLACSLWRKALRERNHAIKHGINGQVRIAGNAAVRREVLRIGTQACFLLAGLSTWAPAFIEPRLLRVLLVWDLVVAALLVTLNSYMDSIDRKRFNDYVYPKEHGAPKRRSDD